MQVRQVEITRRYLYRAHVGLIGGRIDHCIGGNTTEPPLSSTATVPPLACGNSPAFFLSMSLMRASLESAGRYRHCSGAREIAFFFDLNKSCMFVDARISHFEICRLHRYLLLLFPPILLLPKTVYRFHLYHCPGRMPLRAPQWEKGLGGSGGATICFVVAFCRTLQYKPHHGCLKCCLQNFAGPVAQLRLPIGRAVGGNCLFHRYWFVFKGFALLTDFYIKPRHYFTHHPK